MSVTKLLLLILIKAMTCDLLLAQDIDCNSENVRVRLKKGETFISPCDSMVVFTRFSYSRLALEKSLLSKNLRQLELLKSSQDSLIMVLEKDTKDLEGYIATLEPTIEELNTALEQSTKNTEEAIRIARKNRFIWGAAGAGVGVLLGLLLGN